MAEDTAVSFFAPKTLKKFRVERFNGARIAGLYIEHRTGDKNVLHVVDVEWNWYTVTLHNVALESSTTIRRRTAALPAAAGSTTTTEAEGNGSSATPGKVKPLISSRRTVPGRSGQKDETATGGAGGEPVQEAHFHQATGMSEVFCVLLCASGVYEAARHHGIADELAADSIIRFARPLSGCVLAVGAHTGLVVVGQRGQRWLQYSYHADRGSAATPMAAASQQQQRVLSIALESFACSPVDESVAVGGARGELVVYPSLRGTHHFADHWHHTALSAISFSVDGSSLFTGAQESVLLVWNLSSYTFKKIPCQLGPIRCVVPSTSVGSTLLLACATSTLATMDLLQMRRQTSVEGIEWSTGEACRGLVVDSWMGQPVVILTGLPGVLRICDPLTQQAVYSLHVTAQMETVPSPPRHGIQFAGLLRDGRVIVTYESFTPSALPSLLRFWVYDAALRRHVESQTVYRPHQQEVLALHVDKVHDRVFTLSADAMKCWEEIREDPNDEFATEKRSWRNQSTCVTPSGQTASMALSSDGSLCLVADDCVHVYGVVDCQPGQPWPHLATLSQQVATRALQGVVLIESTRVVAAHDTAQVYLWPLASPEDVRVFSTEDTVASICRFAEDSVLVALSNGVVVEIGASQSDLGRERGRVTVSSASPSEGGSRLLYMERLPGEASSTQRGHRVAVVDSGRGFRVLHVSPLREAATPTAGRTGEDDGVKEEQFDGDANRRSAQEEAEKPSSIGQYFAERKRDGDTAGLNSAPLEDAARTAKANRWLNDVLHEPAYAAPPMSSVLTQYLRKRRGLN